VTTTEKKFFLALSELRVIKCIDDKGLGEPYATWLKQFQTSPKNGKERPTIFNPLKEEVNNTEFNNKMPNALITLTWPLAVRLGASPNLTFMR